MTGWVVTYNASPTFRPKWYKDSLNERPDILAMQYTEASEQAARKWAEETIGSMPPRYRTRYNKLAKFLSHGDWIIFEPERHRLSVLSDDEDFRQMWKPAIMCGYND